MSGKKEYIDILYAYTLGCLDRDESINIRNSQDPGEEFPLQELGELQNLSALLPSILLLETPAPIVKDKVARKLYRIRNEIKEKRDKLKKQKELAEKKPVIEKADGENKNNNIPNAEEDPLSSKIKKDITNADRFEVVEPARKNADLFKSAEEFKSEADGKNPVKDNFEFNGPITNPAADEIDTTSEYEGDLSSYNKSEEEKEAEKKAEIAREKRQKRYTNHLEKLENNKKSRSPFFVIIIIVLLIAAMVLLYLKISSDVKKYEAKIDSLNHQVTSLTNQFKQGKDLQLILNSKNLVTVDLEGKGNAESAFGKIFISSDLNKGYVQLSGLPALEGNNSYQLWVEIAGKYKSLGIFKPLNELSYYPIDTPLLNKNSKVNFILTLENSTEAAVPGRDVYLSGMIR